MYHEPPNHTLRRAAARRRSRRLRTRRAPTPRRPTRPPRFAEIYRSRRRTLTVLYVALSLSVIAALLTSPALSIKHIQVQGVAGLLPSEAEATLHAAALPPGTNWLRFSSGAMEERLRALPWIESAQVSRRFANALDAQIQPRTPAVLVQTGPTLLEVDAQGVPIRPARSEVAGRLLAAASPPSDLTLPDALNYYRNLANAAWNAGAKPIPISAFAQPWLPAAYPPTTADGPVPRLPLIVLNRPESVRPGVPFQDAALTAAIQILRSARQDSMVRIAKIEVDQSDNICLNMQDGLSIQFGQVEDYPSKYALVRRIYSREPDIARKLVAINVSCPSFPACTPRSLLPQGESLTR